MKQQPLNRPVLTTGNSSPFLRDQIREDSNHELDWLWSAKQVTALEEIRYCLERALYINPNNYETRDALAKLTQPHATVNGTQRIRMQGRIQHSNR